MGRFDELGKYKETILTKLIKNEDIVKCLYFSNEGDTDFLDKTLPVGFKPSSLIYNNIFPYRFVPSTQDSTKTYITLFFTNFKLVNNAYKSGNIYFYVFTHKALMKTNYGVLRTDFLINKIDEIMNQTRDLGIGKLQFNSMSDFIINDNYLGSLIEYKNYDFN